MIRRIDYRTAATVFFFTGCWFAFGLIALWTPIPGALGIHSEMLVGWILLFFGSLALSGLTLVVAAWNAIFPPNVRPPRRAESLWATPAPSSRTAGQRSHAGRS